MSVSASLLVVADPTVAGTADQLTAVANAVAGTHLEVVLVENGATVKEIPADLDGRLVRMRPPQRLGRRAALRAAAEAATADVCIALGQLARPLPGFAGPLTEAVAGGAGLVAPVLETAAGRVHGYRAESDGHLLPVTEPGRPADALAFDCLAAPRRFWIERMPASDPGAGPAELQLAAAAGPLAVCDDAVVARAAAGPPATVIVCTHNRCEELEPCVEALVAHGAAADGGEILIVDSASDDDTLAIAERLAERVAGVRVVREDVRGLSRARMTGAREARHDVLAYLDDDARPAPGWIESIRSAFADSRVTIAGGPIHGLWQTPHARPPRAAHPYLSLLDHGDRDFRAPVADLYGANWAIRRSALEAAGGFDDQWGVGSVLGALPGEESAVELTLRRLGKGLSRYAVGAAVGHRIPVSRYAETWLLPRVYRHGLILPHVEASFAEPDLGLLQRAAEAAAQAVAGFLPAADVTVADALAAIAHSPASLESRMHAARQLGVLVRCLWLTGNAEANINDTSLAIDDDVAAGRVAPPAAPSRPAARSTGTVGVQPVARPRALAIVPAFNEADVIRHAVLDLIENGLDVYLLDNSSTDGTADAVRDLLGHGLIHIERFPEDSGAAERNRTEFSVMDQLGRIGRLSQELGYDWYLVCDADEFRESPWPDTTLAEGIALADAAGFNALSFEIYNFRPTDDAFVPGTDMRAHITAWEPAEKFDRPQIKAWRNPGTDVDLSGFFVSGPRFEGRRVCPVPFILRHYPIRGETHGRRKVFRDRLPRFAPDERSAGMHFQYDALARSEQPRFVWDRSELVEWDGNRERARLLGRASQALLQANATRGFDLSTEPSTERMAEWLGRTVTVAPPAVGELTALHARISELVRTREDADRDPLLIGLAAMLANEHAVLGNPGIAKALEDIVAGARRPAAERFAAVAFADELAVDGDLLAGYAEAFAADDAATLVILGTSDDLDGLVAAVAATGLDGDDAADLLAITSSDQEPGVVHAVFSRGRSARFGSLPHVADAEALRRLAEDGGHVAARAPKPAAAALGA